MARWLGLHWIRKKTTKIPPGIAIPGEVKTRLGTLTFFDGFPSDATVEKLYDNLDFQHAVQAYLLAIPAVNQAAMRKALLQWGPANKTMPIWEDLVFPRTVGSRTYRLHVPANVSINNFWSVIAYDNQARSFLQTEQTWPSVTSKDKNFQANADGSVDVYFAPKRPKDAKNFIQTIPGKGGTRSSGFTVRLNPGFPRHGGSASLSPSSEHSASLIMGCS